MVYNQKGEKMKKIPTLSPEDRKFCISEDCDFELEPHVSLIRKTKEKTIYDIDYWYCPSCGLMYQHKKQIVEEEK